MSGGQSATTRLFPFLTIFSILFSLFVAPASSRAGCDPGWPECRDLRQTIQDRRNRTATPCDQAIDLMVALQTGAWEFRTRVKHLVETYRAAAERIQARPRQFEEMEARHRDLVARALREGLVVPAGAETPATPAAGVWGVARGAMTFDPVLARKAATYRTEMGLISLRWEEEAMAYEAWAAKETAAFNDQLAAQVASLEDLVESHRRNSKRLLALFDSGLYEHCLGVAPLYAVRYEQASSPSLQAEMREAGLDGAQAETAAARVREAEARLIRLPGELPGMQPVLPAVAGVFPPLIAPKAPPEPHEVKLLRDGAALLKATAELKKTQIEGEKFMLAADAIEAVKYPLKSGKDLAKGIFVDFPVSLAKPMGDFLTLDDRPLDKALADLAKGYTDLAHDLTIGMVTHAAGNAWEITADLVKQSGAVTEYVYGLSGDWSLAGDVAGAFQNLRDHFGRVREMGLGGLVESRRAYPGDDASPAEYAAYLETADRELEAVAGARQQVREASGWVNAHVVDNTRKAVEVYLAAEMAKGVASRLTPRLEALSESFKTTEALADLRKKAADKFIEEQKLAKEVQAREQAGQAVPKEAIELARNITESGPELFTRDLDLMTKAERAGMEDFFREETPAGQSRAVSVEIDGKPLEKALGEGTFKSTYEHPTEPGKVVQTFKTEGEALSQTLARQELSKARLEEAGVGFAKYEVRQLPDGTRIQVADRVLSEAIAENLIKDGKFTAEHAQALRDAMRKLNERDMIATDPNPGNIFFERNPSGVLEAKFLDIDGIVRAKEVIHQKGSSTIDAGRTFDLAGQADLAALQNLILEGHELGGMFNRAIAGEIGKALGTEWYSGVKPSGEVFTPTSVGTFKEALAKAGEPAAKSPAETLTEAVKAAETAEASQAAFLKNRDKLHAEAVQEAALQAEAPASAIAEGRQLLDPWQNKPSEAGGSWSGFDLLDEVGGGLDTPLPRFELPPGL